MLSAGSFSSPYEHLSQPETKRMVEHYTAYLSDNTRLIANPGLKVSIGAGHISGAPFHRPGRGAGGGEGVAGYESLKYQALLASGPLHPGAKKAECVPWGRLVSCDPFDGLRSPVSHMKNLLQVSDATWGFPSRGCDEETRENLTLHFSLRKEMVCCLSRKIKRFKPQRGHVRLNASP